MEHGGGDGDAGGEVGVADEKQHVLAAADVSPCLVTGMLDLGSQPHGVENAEEMGVELVVGLKDVLLHDGGRHWHAPPRRRSPVDFVPPGQGGESGGLVLPVLHRVVHGAHVPCGR